jgi:hypothetical protein
MNNSAIILGIVLSMLYGAAFHLLKGGGFWRLIFYLLLSSAGFLIGNYLAGIIELTWFQIGPLNIGIATIFSILFLFLGYWLSTGGTKKNTPHP